MKIYMVIAYDHYYPCPDNIIFMTDDLKEANKALEEAMSKNDDDGYQIRDHVQIITKDMNVKEGILLRE